ncbi:hypothetical protein [Microbacterium sp. bgisy203]|uniref:hypothetical protein n=1 Tax=Microbacterium sp. bgisy203 TaxID=3413799 RepID=UPI003D72E9E2
MSAHAVRTPFAFVIAGAALALTLSACSSGETNGGAAAPTGSSSRPPFQTTTPGPVGPTGAAVEVPAARWDALVADLESRGVTDAPQLVSAEAVTFADGSLGCASPGQSYTQAQVDGMRVIVTAGDKTYDYRFGSGDALVLCER